MRPSGPVASTSCAGGLIRTNAADFALVAQAYTMDGREGFIEICSTGGVSVTWSSDT